MGISSISFPISVKAAFSMEVKEVLPLIVTSNEQEVSVSTSLISLPSASFFRVAWQSADGGSYFGYIKDNSGSWVKVTSSQNCANYYSVTDTNISSLSLVTKIGDDYVPENGNYVLKVRRYTSTCGSYLDSNSYPIEINLPVLSSTPSPTPTSEPIAVKSTYKINKPKDGGGSVLSGVQIYIDGNYIHHEDDEVLEFFNGHECYAGVECSLGTHTISLRKSGYISWEDTENFSSGMNLEVNPTLLVLKTNSPSPTVSPIVSPKTVVKTASPSAQKNATDSNDLKPPEILGVGGVLGSNVVESDSEDSKKIPILPTLLILLGFVLIGFSIFSVIKNTKKGYTGEDVEKNI